MVETRTGSQGRVGLDAEQAALCERFLGWQCRLRQHAVRQLGGRPVPGMQPRVELPGGRDLGRVTVLMVLREAEPVTAQFRHLAVKTQDPAERYQAVLRVLAAAYYQRHEDFTDQLVALFNLGARRAEELAEAGQAVLHFEQAAERYLLPAAVRALESGHPAYQSAYWHNYLFNPAMPAAMSALVFLPDWSAARHTAVEDAEA